MVPVGMWWLLIRENLHTLLVSSKAGRELAKVLARFANMPEPEYHENLEYIKAARSAAVLDTSRYEVKPLNPERIPGLFAQRGISEETVRELAPFIVLIRDRHNGNFEGFNIGFPYTNGMSEEAKGYEIRGYGGYKSKAAAAALSRHGWRISPKENAKEDVKTVYFCESALDAMAFYRRTGCSCTRIWLWSLWAVRFRPAGYGGDEPFSSCQGFQLLDNDLAGRIYGLRMVALLENIPMKISKTNKELQVEVKDKVFTVNPHRPCRLSWKNTCLSAIRWGNGFTQTVQGLEQLC